MSFNPIQTTIHVTNVLLFFVLSRKVAIFVTKLRLDMESIAHKIENRIKGFGRGKIFFADDFLDFGLYDGQRLCFGCHKG